MAAETTTKCPHTNSILERVRKERSLTGRAQALNQIVVEWDRMEKLLNHQSNGNDPLRLVK